MKMKKNNNISKYIENSRNAQRKIGFFPLQECFDSIRIRGVWIRIFKRTFTRASLVLFSIIWCFFLFESLNPSTSCKHFQSDAHGQIKLPREKD